MEINFFPKGYSKEASNFPFKDNLKKPAHASKWDGLVLVTLKHSFIPAILQYFFSKEKMFFMLILLIF